MCSRYQQVFNLQDQTRTSPTQKPLKQIRCGAGLQHQLSSAYSLLLYRTACQCKYNYDSHGIF